MTTWHFEHEVQPDRPYLDIATCDGSSLPRSAPKCRRTGASRLWGEVTLPSEREPRIIRVVTLEDGETIHTAFIDRNYRRADAP